ncbi:MAG: hypothetical protein AAGA29_05235 [Planctomycetota bacterium]
MTINPKHILSRLVIAAGVCAAVALPGCDEAQEAQEAVVGAPGAGLTAQEAIIHDAVEALIARGDGASITVTDVDGTRYVKLGMDGSDIVASLPLSWLNDPQTHTTARELFADAGAAGSSELPSFESTDLFPEFNVELGGDLDVATQFTADVLELVYALAPQESLIFETEDD